MDITYTNRGSFNGPELACYKNKEVTKYLIEQVRMNISKISCQEINYYNLMYLIKKKYIFYFNHLTSVQITHIYNLTLDLKDYTNINKKLLFISFYLK